MLCPKSWEGTGMEGMRKAFIDFFETFDYGEVKIKKGTLY